MALGISLGTFYGIDSLIDLLIVLTAFLVANQSRHIYQLTKENHYRYFSFAFASIGIGFLFKILSNLTSIYAVVLTRSNFIAELFEELVKMQLFYFGVFTLYKIFFVSGLLLLFLIFTKTQRKENLILFSYLSVISVLFSVYFTFVFHLTLALLSGFLVMYFRRNYLHQTTKRSYTTYLAFSLIFCGGLVGLIMGVHPLLYLVDEILFLVGFSIILATHMGVYHGKKTNKT